MLRVIATAGYFRYREFIDAVLERCGRVVKQKDEEYGGSWKARGGRSAWFMLCRKWDRLEVQVAKHADDVFAAAEADQREEGVLDDVRDLIGYLVLVEAEISARRSRIAVVGQHPPAIDVQTTHPADACPHADAGHQKCDRAKCSRCNSEMG